MSVLVGISVDLFGEFAFALTVRAILFITFASSVTFLCEATSCADWACGNDDFHSSMYE